MPLAIFGISNGGLNLVATLFVMALVVVWLALIVWTYFDARRRIEDPVLVACATAASLFPYIGTFVYSILRPPEFLDDAKERKLEIKAAELRVRQLSELACPNCNYPVEKSYLRCPNCQRRLKDPCESCGKPVDPRWALCPYCETALPGRQPPTRKAEPGQRKPTRGAPQRPASRRTAAAQRSAQRTASPTAAKGKSSDADSDPAEAPERPQAARRK
jgi:RNA polymerase subunit RPABC4/transcription elongation factor Spt4